MQKKKVQKPADNTTRGRGADARRPETAADYEVPASGELTLTEKLLAAPAGPYGENMIKKGDAHAGHRGRLRDKFLRDPAAMEDHELLELLLCYAVPRRDTNPMAHDLLQTFGSLSAVMKAEEVELCSVKGIGPEAAALLRMIPEITARFSADRLKKKPNTKNPEEVRLFLESVYIQKNFEAVLLLCLDARLRVISCRQIASGDVGSASLSVGRVAELALVQKATSVILSHNHPDGDPTPSSEDVTTTEILYRSLKPLGVHLVDHIIFGGQDTFSFAANGMMPTA